MSDDKNTTTLDSVEIVHSKSGARATVYPFGATVTSFQTASNKELLFVSRIAKYDGSKAIRGGIPLVFPQFGQPDKSMPQHGFLRVNTWTVDTASKFDEADSAGINLTLPLMDVQKARGDGPWKEDATPKLDCLVTYSIVVQAESLTTSLTIRNTGNHELEFQTLLHTYYKVAGSKALDSSLCNVRGLGGYQVVDKVTNEEYEQSAEDAIFIDREVDRIYTPPADKPKVEVEIATGEDNAKVKLQAHGSVDGTTVPVSCVVWNPHVEKAKAMGDFADEQYQDMICVEPGLLQDVPKLAAGKEATFSQTMTAL